MKAYVLCTQDIYFSSNVVAVTLDKNKAEKWVKRNFFAEIVGGQKHGGRVVDEVEYSPRMVDLALRRLREYGCKYAEDAYQYVFYVEEHELT